MIVTNEGIYRGADNKLYDVVNVHSRNIDLPPYYRVYFEGGWYNVNVEPNNTPFDQIEIEMIEYVGPLPTAS